MLSEPKLAKMFSKRYLQCLRTEEKTLEMGYLHRCLKTKFQRSEVRDKKDFGGCNQRKLLTSCPLCNNGLKMPSMRVTIKGEGMHSEYPGKWISGTYWRWFCKYFDEYLSKPLSGGLKIKFWDNIIFTDGKYNSRKSLQTRCFSDYWVQWNNRPSAWTHSEGSYTMCNRKGCKYFFCVLFLLRLPSSHL